MGGTTASTASFASAILGAAQGSSIGLIVWKSGPSGPTLAFANDAAARLLGITPDEIASDPAGAREIIRRLEGAPGTRAGTRSGRLEVLSRAVSHGGQPAEVSFLLDVSEERAAEDRLAAALVAFRRVLDLAPDAIAVGTRSRLLYINPALAALLDEDADEVIRHPITRFIHPDDHQRAMDLLDEIARTGNPTPSVPFVLRGKGDRTIPVELSAMLVEWDGQPAILAAGRDVSERRRARMELAGADRLSAIGTLTAGIAHEVNNPLAYVLLNLQYLLREIQRYDGSDAMTAKLVERLGEAQHGARRVAGIVADLRTLARSDERSVGPISIESSLRSSVRIASSTFKDRARLVEQYRVAPPVEANAAKLEQVFVNLLVNAGQAVPEDALDDHAITVRLFTEGDQVIATVTDTGSGIAPEALGRIFDPFFTTKPRGLGTGLGLPISYQIVTALGGELTVDSTPGRGTTFRVALPASKRLPLAEPRTPTPPPVRASVRARVLVIDDEPLVTDMLRRVFGELHDVTVTTSPTEGLSLILERDFDVVFCDLLMPGLSGMDLHERLSESKPGAEERIVFMTGGAFTERAAEFLARVKNRRIVKPFEISDLEQALVRVAFGTAK